MDSDGDNNIGSDICAHCVCVCIEVSVYIFYSQGFTLKIDSISCIA